MPVNTTNASELLQERVAKVLIKPRAEASKFLAAGPQIFDTSSPLGIPKLAGPIGIEWIGESEEIPDDEELDLDEVELLPSTMKSTKTIIRRSNEMFRASQIALDSVLRQRLVTDVPTKLDAQLSSAGGDGITLPQGIFAYAGTRNVAVRGALTLDHLLDACGMASSQLGGATAFWSPC